MAIFSCEICIVIEKWYSYSHGKINNQYGLENFENMNFLRTAGVTVLNNNIFMCEQIQLVTVDIESSMCIRKGNSFLCYAGLKKITTKGVLHYKEI